MIRMETSASISVAPCWDLERRGMLMAMSTFLEIGAARHGVRGNANAAGLADTNRSAKAGLVGGIRRFGIDLERLGRTGEACAAEDQGAVGGTFEARFCVRRIDSCHGLEQDL